MEYKNYRNVKHKAFRVFSNGGSTIFGSDSITQWMTEHPKCMIIEYHVLPDSSGKCSYWIDILYSDWGDESDG